MVDNVFANLIYRALIQPSVRHLPQVSVKHAYMYAIINIISMASVYTHGFIEARPTIV